VLLEELMRGHLWTIGPNLRHRLVPHRPPPSSEWSTTLQDPQLGALRLTGQLHQTPAAKELAILLHGLGGTIDSQYTVKAARAAAALGIDALRLALRGADRRGEDFYHAGLTEDLSATLRDQVLARYERIYILGFSLGGHMTLRWALAPDDPRVRAVVAVCAPLDLAASCVAIDRPGAAVYLRHLLGGLREIYGEVARRRGVPTPLPAIAQVETMRAWDRLTVVPRFGFCSVDHYYASQSVGPRLRALERPALIVAARADPMVPPATLAPALADVPEHVETRWTPGGHVGFPAGLDLGLGARPGLEHQVFAWLRRH